MVGCTMVFENCLQKAAAFLSSSVGCRWLKVIGLLGVEVSSKTSCREFAAIVRSCSDGRTFLVLLPIAYGCRQR